MVCGLLGRKLAHSYSPQIHAYLQDYVYQLFEKEPEQVGEFLKSGGWDGLNVTIPYKKDVLPYCDELSETVRAVGSANTLVRRKDGSIFADNTDAFGFAYLLRKNAINVSAKKVLVFGSGGASVTVQYVLKALGAGTVVVISRTGENNYVNLSRHADAQILVNTTPLGMYPNNGESPVRVADFKRCEAVVDLIYNPAKTALGLQAQRLGIAFAYGLSMLVAQAKRSSELFTGTAIADEKIAEITAKLDRRMRNILLIGMPGCGKSTIGKMLAAMTNRAFADSDAEIVKQIGMPIPDFFKAQGEAAFRDVESSVLKELTKQSGAVIATGGGAVLREENADYLHQNSRVIWLKRELALLAKNGRPISQNNDLSALFEMRRPLYEKLCDVQVENNAAPAEVCRRILEELE